jgi:hypothetical protein
MILPPNTSSRDGVEPPPPAFSGAAETVETVLAVIYENVEGCASTVRTPKATGKRATTTGWFFKTRKLRAKLCGNNVHPDRLALV